MIISLLGKSVKSILLLLAFLLPSVCAEAALTQDDFFVRIHADKEKIYSGDSLLLSVVIYASYPIQKIEVANHYKVKGDCKVRKIKIDRNSALGRTQIGNRIYYTLVWEHYVVSSKNAGNIEFFSPTFKGVLKETVYMPDWTEMFMGAEPKYRIHKVKSEVTKRIVQVQEKPLRSTQEMMRNRIVL